VELFLIACVIVLIFKPARTSVFGFVVQFLKIAGILGGLALLAILVIIGGLYVGLVPFLQMLHGR